MKPKLNLKNWRTTTALCVVSTMAVATASVAAGSWGQSGWDSRAHPTTLAAQLQNTITQDLNNIFGNSGLGGGMGNGGGSSGNGSGPAETVKTASPIKHVIVLIGENRGLDHTFGVYKPKGSGQTISNLLSKGIVNEDGTAGPNFAQAQQFSVATQSSFYIGAPTISKSPYGATNTMPQPNTNGAPSAQSATGAPFKTIAEASVRKGHGSGISRHPDHRLHRLADRISRYPRAGCGNSDRSVPDAGSGVDRRRLYR